MEKEETQQPLDQSSRMRWKDCNGTKHRSVRKTAKFVAVGEKVAREVELKTGNMVNAARYAITLKSKYMISETVNDIKAIHIQGYGGIERQKQVVGKEAKVERCVWRCMCRCYHWTISTLKLLKSKA